jgi:hypothetical protein
VPAHFKFRCHLIELAPSAERSSVTEGKRCYLADLPVFFVCLGDLALEDTAGGAAVDFVLPVAGFVEFADIFEDVLLIGEPRQQPGFDLAVVRCEKRFPGPAITMARAILAATSRGFPNA